MAAGIVHAQTPVPSPAATVNLWPEGKMPGKGTDSPEETKPGGDGTRRISNVSVPTLDWYPAPRQTTPGPTIIVCPGGGYSHLTYDKEGTEIATWLNSAGISALVLKYRVPKNHAGSLQDLQRALSLARAHAAEWKIDPQRLGVLGFSAGGNLAAKASTHFDERGYPAIDAVDQQSCRPEFVVLVYPAYLEGKKGELTTDVNLKAKIPPTIIIHNEDDGGYVPGSKLYHAALDAAKAPNEFVLYPTGGHGYGLHCTGAAKAWPQAALDWLHKNGIK